MVMGKYGTLVAGKAVYAQFWSEECVSQLPLEWHQQLPILVGIDTSGLHPGAVFCQAYAGRVHALREVHAKDTPFDSFCESVLCPFIQQNFRQNSLTAVVDPSNPRLGVGGKTAMQILEGFGVHAVPAPTNRINQRLGAVSKLLQRRKAFIIDPSCKLLIEGFRGKYHYKKIDSSGLIEAYKPEPEKDVYADIHDAMQYAALYYERGSGNDKIVIPQRRVMMV